MKAVPPPLTGNYMPPSNIPDVDESQMVYGKKATDSSEIKTNDDSISHSYDSVLFDFSDSYLHLIKYCDLHEQRFAKRNAEWKVSAGQQNPISADPPNPVFAKQQNTVSAVSQICDQTHRVLFTENECLVLSKDFPLPDPSMVVLAILRKHNLYTFSLNELALKGPLTCLIAKASQNESTL
nr:putative ribonuclease H-like domain-containing protein [Tanacetum cinerariifolium]